MPSSGSSLSSIAPVDAAGPKQAPAASAPIRVILVMTSELDRWAWSIVIGKQDDMELLSTLSSSRQVLEALRSPAPDVLVIDEDILTSFNDPDSLTGAIQSRAVGLVLVAMHQPDYSMEPSRYACKHTRLLKGFSAPKLLAAIRAIAMARTSMRGAGE